MTLHTTGKQVFLSVLKVVYTKILKNVLEKVRRIYKYVKKVFTFKSVPNESYQAQVTFQLYHLRVCNAYH